MRLTLGGGRKKAEDKNNGLCQAGRTLLRKKISKKE
jgi:hypothetical protein